MPRSYLCSPNVQRKVLPCRNTHRFLTLPTYVFDDHLHLLSWRAVAECLDKFRKKSTRCAIVVWDEMAIHQWHRVLHGLSFCPYE